METKKPAECEICTEPFKGSHCWFAGSWMHPECEKEAIQLVQDTRPADAKNGSTMFCNKCGDDLTLEKGQWKHKQKSPKCKSVIDDRMLIAPSFIEKKRVVQKGNRACYMCGEANPDTKHTYTGYTCGECTAKYEKELTSNKSLPVAAKSKPIKKKLPMEKKVVWVAQFDKNSLANVVIGKEEAQEPVIAITEPKAIQAKYERITEILDVFYQHLREQRYMPRRTAPREFASLWHAPSEISEKDSGYPSPIFITKQAAQDFIDLQQAIQRDEKPDMEWVRKVCQSYLKLEMTITKGTFMTEVNSKKKKE